MNDQTKQRPPAQGAPLQGKVVLEPVIPVAAQEPAPAPAQRLEEAMDSSSSPGCNAGASRRALGDAATSRISRFGAKLAIWRVSVGPSARQNRAGGGGLGRPKTRVVQFSV